MSAFDPLRTLGEGETLIAVRPDDIRSFAKAVAAGTAAVGVPLVLITLPLAVSDLFQPMSGKLNILGDLYLAVMPLLISFPLVLIGSVAIGIPTIIILRRSKADDLRRYVVVGVIAGFLIPMIGSIALGAEWGPSVGMGFYGAFSGGITALTWSIVTRA